MDLLRWSGSSSGFGRSYSCAAIDDRNRYHLLGFLTVVVVEACGHIGHAEVRLRSLSHRRVIGTVVSIRGGGFRIATPPRVSAARFKDETGYG